MANATWRIQLKPESEKGISYRDLLEFCKSNQIIGVGWYLIEGHEDSYEALRDEIYSIEMYKNGESRALKAVNAIRQMQSGDLIWTRLGGDASEYYLCKVGNALWKDRVVTDVHRKYDIGNFVSAKWVKVGKEENVPGKVVNSFCVSATAQRVSDVDEISKLIWNKYVDDEEEKYDNIFVNKNSFWNMIGSEELESLILLYLQSKGYYIYSSTLKLSTAKFEATLVHKDDTHRAYPQVKRETPLLVKDYISALDKESDRIYLFTTSENYGEIAHPQIICISKQELEKFITQNRNILPANILYWLDLIEE